MSKWPVNKSGLFRRPNIMMSLRNRRSSSGWSLRNACVCVYDSDLRPPKCHRDRDEQKFGSVSDVTPTTPPTPSAGLRGRARVKCRRSKTRAEGEREMGHSCNRFQGDEDFNSKRRLRWSGRSSAGEGESASQHLTSYTWVNTHRFHVQPTFVPHTPPTDMLLLTRAIVRVTSLSHTWPIHL